MQRFVDRGASVMLRRMRHKGRLAVSIEENDDIVVEGRTVGRLAGFAFRPDEGAADSIGEDMRVLECAAAEALAGEIARRVKVFLNVGHQALALDLSGGPGRPRLLWQNEPVVEIVRGDTLFRPALRLVSGSLLGEPEARTVEACCADWLAGQMRDKLAPLMALGEELAGPAPPGDEDAPLAGLARGVAFRLHEQLGVLARKSVAAELREIDQEARKGLRRFGIRIGATALYIPALLKPRAAELRLMLWALWNEVDRLPEPPTPGLVWIATDPAAPREFYELAGFRLIGGHEAIRLDMLERLADAARPLGQGGAKFPVTPEIMGLVGCSGDSFARAMRAIGYGFETETVTPEPVEPPPEAQEAPEPVEAAPFGEPPAPVERRLFFWSPPRPRPKKPVPVPVPVPVPAAAEKPTVQRDKRKKSPKPTPARKASRPASPPANESSPFAGLGALRDALARKG